MSGPGQRVYCRGFVEQIALDPVDGVHITTLVDNSCDVLLPDRGLVRRWGLAGTAGEIPVVPTEMAEGGRSLDFLRAEHGFSALIELRDESGSRRVLFDAGITPDGLIGNLDRLGIAPDTFEAIVFSHGHFDHVMGVDGLIERMGRTNVPVLLHPDFWTRRRVMSPSGKGRELPLPSRAGIEGAGFAVIEDAQPSLLLDDKLLVTGEIDRTTDFEKGMPTHQAWRNGDWEPDPLIHDDQAVILNVRGKGLVVLTGCGHSGIVNIVRHAKTPHRRGAGLRSVGWVPSLGSGLRGTYPADCGCSCRRVTGSCGTCTLHGLDGTVGASDRDARCVHAEFRRKSIRAVKLTR